MTERILSALMVETCTGNWRNRTLLMTTMKAKLEISADLNISGALLQKLLSTAELNSDANEPDHDLVDGARKCEIRDRRKKIFSYTRVKKHGKALQHRRKTTQPVIVVAVISDGQFENQNCKVSET